MTDHQKTDATSCDAAGDAYAAKPEIVVTTPDTPRTAQEQSEFVIRTIRVNADSCDPITVPYDAPEEAWKMRNRMANRAIPEASTRAG